MGTEIERKFIVIDETWRTPSVATIDIQQGYLNRDSKRTVRVRVADEQGWLTVKGKTNGIRRLEFEYTIPVEEARELLLLCEHTIIEKRRSVIDCHGMKWEVDEFVGENAGLVIAEVELESEEQVFDLPNWAGIEVTQDFRYSNSNLSKNAFSNWDSTTMN